MLHYYRPQTKFAKVMFLQVSVCPHRGVGVVCMFFLGGCMVLFGGHAWFYLGGHAWFYLGGCVVLFGGMHGFIWGGGMCGFIWGGMHGFLGGVCMVFLGGMRGFFSFFGYNEIRSMSGRYASYWNAFLFQ